MSSEDFYKLFKTDAGNYLDNLVSPYEVANKNPVKLEPGFSSAQSDPLGDLQLLRFKQFEPDTTVGKKGEYMGVVLSVEDRRENTSSPSVRNEPEISVRVRIPYIHSHLPCPRSPKDRVTISLYPTFNTWYLSDIGGKKPKIGSIVKVSFPDPRNLSMTGGPGTLRSIVHINAPGLPEWSATSNNSFSNNLLDGTGALMRKCGDQETAAEKVSDPSGQPINIPLETLAVSPRHPRKVNSPYVNHNEVLLSPIAEPDPTGLVPNWLTPKEAKEYALAQEEWRKNIDLARELDQPKPPPPKILDEYNKKNLKIAMIPVGGLATRGLKVADLAKEATIAGVQHLAGEDSFIGQATEATLDTPEYLLKKSYEWSLGIIMEPFEEIQKNRANARKTLARAKAFQQAASGANENKSRVAYGQNKDSGTPPNKSVDCSKIYSMNDFNSKALDEYMKEIDTSGTEKTWDKHTNQKLATLHPKIRGKAYKFVKACEAVGIFLRVTAGFRSYAHQDEIYAKGRTIPNDSGKLPGRTVTQARGGQSVHNFGLAFDVVEVWHKETSMPHYKEPIKRRGSPTGKFKSLKAQTGWDSKYPEARWQMIGKIGEKLGFTWGFHFSKPKDRPHFQSKFGKSTKQLRKMTSSPGRNWASMRFREKVNVPRSALASNEPRRSEITYPKI